MEEVKEDVDMSKDLWTIDIPVSHEVTVVTEETSERGISVDNSLQNLTKAENSHGENDGKNPRNDEQNFACANADAAIVTRQEVCKEMDNCEEPKRAKKSLQRQSFTTYKQTKDTNRPSPSEEVPVKDVPAALICSAHKLFPAVPLNIQDRVKYPKIKYRFTPIVKDEEDVEISLSQISLGNTSTSVVSSKQNVTSAGTVCSYTSYQGRAAYPARNTGNINIENTYFLPNTQYKEIGNDNRRIGLKNTESTCYINCVMQVLLATHKFSVFTVTKMYTYPYWAILAELFGSMMFTVYPVINPRKYYARLNSLHFNIFQEHDVSEFFIYLLELLRSFEPNWDKDWSDNAGPSTSSDVRDHAVAGCSYQTPDARSKKRPKIIGFDESRKFFVNHTFGGIIATTVKCNVCKNVTTRHEMLYILHLAIPDTTSNEVFTIQMLLEKYFTPETLSGVNRYMCNTCRRQQNAQKSSIVVCTPKHLVLTLKNFSYDPKLRMSTKKNPKIHCEETITLHSSTRQKERTMYELYAVIVHHGLSLRTGHYTAITKYNNQWYMINDSDIHNIDFSDMNCLKIDETPYMLFYRRADIKEGCFPDYDKMPWFLRYTENKPYAQNN